MRVDIRIPMALAIGLAFAAPAFAADPSGVWLSATGQTKVRIAPCGDDYCGTILQANVPEQKDVKNPDVAKRDRPLVGINLIYGMKADGEGYSGKLYDYTSGKTYSGKLVVEGGKLKLSGCVMAVLCKTETWSKAQ